MSRQLEIELQFTDDGAKRFAQITRTNVDRRLAVVMQGRVLCAPRIASEIPGGKVVIAGRFSEAESTELVWALNRSVSPTPALKIEHEGNLCLDPEQPLAGQVPLFDLDRAQALAWPPELSDWNALRIGRWIEESGADLLVAAPFSPNEPALCVFGTTLVPVDDIFWTDPPDRTALLDILSSTNATPMRPLPEIHPEARIVTLGPALPITYVFRTAEGVVGLLRITAFTEQPTGLDFLYRLVE
jgi:hypothetical protein